MASTTASCCSAVCKEPGPEHCPVPSPQGSICLLKADAEQIPSPEHWPVGASPPSLGSLKPTTSFENPEPGFP